MNSLILDTLGSAEANHLPLLLAAGCWLLAAAGCCRLLPAVRSSGATLEHLFYVAYCFYFALLVRMGGGDATKMQHLYLNFRHSIQQIHETICMSMPMRSSHCAGFCMTFFFTPFTFMPFSLAFIAFMPFSLAFTAFVSLAFIGLRLRSFQMRPT